jgi:hypothetical protein
MNHFDIKKKIIESDGSEVLKEWQKLSNISKEDFIEAIEWVCQDTFDECGRTTRKIGLEPDRIVKLKVAHDDENGITAFYNIEDNFRWDGANFKIPVETEKEKIFADENGLLLQTYKIYMDANGRV